MHQANDHLPNLLDDLHPLHHLLHHLSCGDGLQMMPLGDDAAPSLQKDDDKKQSRAPMFDDFDILSICSPDAVTGHPYLMHMYAFIRNLELRFIFVIWF